MKKLNPTDYLKSIGFTIHKQLKIYKHTIFVDDFNKWFCISTKKSTKVYSFRDLLDFELNEDGASIMQGKTGASLLGGLTFGVAGAVIGSAGKRKSVETCNSMVVRIMVNSLQEPQIVIPLLSVEIKKNTMTYQSIKNKAKELAAMLMYIQNQAV